MKPIAGIIAARGGSTRVPGKNIMDFCGRPLIVWTIIQGKCVPGIRDIYLSTDSEEIAVIGRPYGVKIHMREDPWESADTTPGSYPTLATIKKYNLIEHAIVLLMATSPLRCQKDWHNMMKIFYKHDEKYQALGLIPRNDIHLSRRMPDDSNLPFFSYNRERFEDNDDLGFLDHSGTFVSITPADIYETSMNREVVKDRDLTGEVHWDHLVRHKQYHLKHFLMEEWQKYDIDEPTDIEMAEYFFVKKGLKDYWNKQWEEMQ